jgi:hypothetical protein
VGGNIRNVTVALVSSVVVVLALAGCAGSPAHRVAKPTSTSGAAESNDRPAAPLKSASGDARQSCAVIRESSKSIVGGYQSPWVRSLPSAEAYASLAAQKDPRWQSLASDLTSMQAARPPGTQLPPSPATPQQLQAYWSNYQPLIGDCAPAGVVLPKIVVHS